MGKFAALLVLLMMTAGFLAMKFVGNPLLDGGKETTTATTPIVLRSTPTGASVTIDGTALEGKTPMLVERALTEGEHKVEFTKDDAKVSSSFTFKKDQRAVFLSVPLREKGPVLVKLRPRSAKVFVDGEPVNDLEKLELSFKQDHKLEARKAGYKSASTTVPADRALEHKVELTLVKEGPKGRVIVLTHPNSDLVVDGQAVAQSGMSEVELPVGPHTLSLAVSGLDVEREYQIEVPETGVGRYYFDLTAGAQ